jgi:ADP-heptose:LPS heptosyltransferase
LLGRDVETGTLLDSLQKLNNSHIFIGPMGLPVHAAAGLGVDTISVTSVFPNHYDSPEYYHSGWHRSIKSSIHCGDYRCVTEKIYTQDSTVEGPKTKWGFWPKKCPHTENKLSCVYNVSPDKLIETFADWYTEKGKNLWSR